MKFDLCRCSSDRNILLALALVFVFWTSSVRAQEAPSFSIGAFGGFAASMTTEAVKGYEETEWDAGAAYGASIIYRLKNGLAFELLVERFAMELSEDGEDLGKLTATPILLMVKYQGMPKKEKGIAFHAEIGGGFASSEFEKGDFLKDLEDSSGNSVDISNDGAFIFELGGGLDYFFNRNIALTLDGRFLSGNIDSEWDYNNGNKDDFTFYASNFQGLVGIRFWF